MKKFALILLFIPSILFAQREPVDKARGFFLAFGVGPRLPISSFANSTDLGYGFNVELSYTDNQYLPVFLYTKIGFEQYPGAQSYYESSDYSNYSTNVLPVSVGARYYFPPFINSIVLLMPIIEASANYNYYQILHQFKFSSGKSNYLENISKFGFSAGTGISMFMLEVVASYNYFVSNQYIAVDLKVRLPLYINL